MADELAEERQKMEDEPAEERQETADELAEERQKMTEELEEERQRMADELAEERDRMVEQQTQERQRMVDQQEDLMNTLGELDTERAQLKNQISVLTTKASEASNRCKQLESWVQQLKGKAQVDESTINELSAKNANAVERLRASEAESSSLRKKISALMRLEERTKQRLQQLAEILSHQPSPEGARLRDCVLTTFEEISQIEYDLDPTEAIDTTTMSDVRRGDEDTPIRGEGNEGVDTSHASLRAIIGKQDREIRYLKESVDEVKSRLPPAASTVRGNVMEQQKHSESSRHPKTATLRKAAMEDGPEAGSNPAPTNRKQTGASKVLDAQPKVTTGKTTCGNKTPPKGQSAAPPRMFTVDPGSLKNLQQQQQQQQQQQHQFHHHSPQQQQQRMHPGRQFATTGGSPGERGNGNWWQVQQPPQPSLPHPAMINAAAIRFARNGHSSASAEYRSVSPPAMRPGGNYEYPIPTMDATQMMMPAQPGAPSTFMNAPGVLAALNNRFNEQQQHLPLTPRFSREGRLPPAGLNDGYNSQNVHLSHSRNASLNNLY
eukprot:GHVU01022299.1.p1 GENE.GHVU01022299.1~~GHVU01022299.1.p1  ORF type:complete len:632 (-),score=128.54 GHVU01022299.1:331-1977(-)